MPKRTWMKATNKDTMLHLIEAFKRDEWKKRIHVTDFKILKYKLIIVILPENLTFEFWHRFSIIVKTLVVTGEREL